MSPRIHSAGRVESWVCSEEKIVEHDDRALTVRIKEIDFRTHVVSRGVDGDHLNVCGNVVAFDVGDKRKQVVVQPGIAEEVLIE